MAQSQVIFGHAHEPPQIGNLDINVFRRAAQYEHTKTISASFLARELDLMLFCLMVCT